MAEFLCAIRVRNWPFSIWMLIPLTFVLMNASCAIQGRWAWNRVLGIAVCLKFRCLITERSFDLIPFFFLPDRDLVSVFVKSKQILLAICQILSLYLYALWHKFVKLKLPCYLKKKIWQELMRTAGVFIFIFVFYFIFVLTWWPNLVITSN